MRSDKMLRGKRRYIVFLLNEIMDSKSAHMLIYGQLMSCLGTFGLENVKYRFLKERFDEKERTGIIRVNVETLNDVRRALELFKDRITIIGVSGIIKKTSRFLANKQSVTAKKQKLTESSKKENIKNNISNNIKINDIKQNK